MLRDRIDLRPRVCEREVLALRPQRGEVGVVRAARLAGLARGARRQCAVPVGEVDQVAVRRAVKLPELVVVARVVRGVPASPGRSKGPTSNAFPTAGSSAESGWRNVAVWSAPHLSRCGAGSFFSSSTARANVSRSSRSRPPFGSGPNHSVVGFSRAESMFGTPPSETSAGASSFGTCGL